MRKVGIVGLILVGVISGAAAGAVVGALSVSAGARTTTKIIHEKIVSPSSRDVVVDRTVPVTSAVSVVNKVGPAVVTIKHSIAPTFDPYGGETSPGGTALGSGFFIDNKGDIVTNNHVISGSKKFTVIFANGKATSATLVGADPTNDIAVVHVNGNVPAVATFGSSDAIEPGEPVVAIGNALGEFQNTVTEGIISGLHRNLGQLSQNMIQTDAAINHGNSGGPLLDMAGQVIGMNTAIDRSTGETSSDPFDQSDPNTTVAEGLGFAIPSNTVSAIAKHLIHHLPPGYLGVEYTPVEADVTIPLGDLVEKVYARSPADEAGVKVNDIVTAVDGIPVTQTTTLEDLISPHAAGEVVKLRVWRAFNYETLKVRLGKQPASKQ